MVNSVGHSICLQSFPVCKDDPHDPMGRMKMLRLSQATCGVGGGLRGFTGMNWAWRKPILSRSYVVGDTQEGIPWECFPTQDGPVLTTDPFFCHDFTIQGWFWGAVFEKSKS